jgi:hypothetical protein
MINPMISQPASKGKPLQIPNFSCAMSDAGRPSARKTADGCDMPVKPGEAPFQRLRTLVFECATQRRSPAFRVIK